MSPWRGRATTIAATTITPPTSCMSETPSERSHSANSTPRNGSRYVCTDAVDRGEVQDVRENDAEECRVEEPSDRWRPDPPPVLGDELGHGDGHQGDRPDGHHEARQLERRVARHERPDEHGIDGPRDGCAEREGVTQERTPTGGALPTDDDQDHAAEAGQDASPMAQVEAFLARGHGDERGPQGDGPD